jgi:hypothetical protein
MQDPKNFRLVLIVIGLALIPLTVFVWKMKPRQHVPALPQQTGRTALPGLSQPSNTASPSYVPPSYRPPVLPISSPAVPSGNSTEEVRTYLNVVYAVEQRRERQSQRTRQLSESQRSSGTVNFAEVEQTLNDGVQDLQQSLSGLNEVPVPSSCTEFAGLYKDYLSWGVSALQQSARGFSTAMKAIAEGDMATATATRDEVKRVDNSVRAEGPQRAATVDAALARLCASSGLVKGFSIR